MSIECTFKTKNQSITIDLEKHLGNFESLVDVLFQDVNINTLFEVVDTDYFNSMDEVETFLGIKFPYGYLPHTFLAWISFTGNLFSEFALFNDEYQGVFQEPKEFCKEYIKKETNINSMPTCVVECIDYQKMWDGYLSDHFYTLKVEDESLNNISMYTYAIFKK
jgi:hypothetical protein